MKMKYYLSFSIILISKIILSQNLIYNGGFEIIKKCPDNYSQISLATGWNNIYNGCMYEANLYNSCSDPSKFNMAIPGLEKPRTGSGYAGIHAGEHQTIQTKLIQKLIKGNKYRVEFYLKSAKGSECALTPIYGLLTKYSDMDSIIKCEDIDHQVCIKDYKGLLNTAEWVKVEGVYTATGEEKYFTISYINTDKKWFCLCLYSIDDISVYPLDNDLIIPQEITIKDTFNYKQGDVFILKNVNFEFDKSELLPESFLTLGKLLLYLQENKNYTISIKGYSDNTGTEKHNIELSKERAKAVYRYLLDKGISKIRMKYEGYGSSKPLNDNLSEANRQNNRRVEIIIERKN